MGLTQDGNSYLHNGNKIYGRVNSDETICKQVARLKLLREEFHIESQYFISARNIVKVKWNEMFHDYEKLAKRFPMMDTNKELAA